MGGESQRLYFGSKMNGTGGSKGPGSSLPRLIYKLLLIVLVGQLNKINPFAFHFMGNEVKYTLVIFKYLRCHLAMVA